jgi:glucose-6-phosphate isomerase
MNYSIAQYFEFNAQHHRAMTREAGGLLFDFSKQAISAEALQNAQRILREKQAFDAFKRLAHGEIVNATEARAATHMRERDLALSGRHDALRATAEHIAASKIEAIVSIGIGGSDLGLRLADDVFQASGLKQRVALRFCTGLDPAEWHQAIAGLSPQTTAFVLASKSFGTVETLTTGDRARAWLRSHANERMYAVTSAPVKARAYGIVEHHIVPFDESVGGRYSIWSAVNLPLRVAYGNAPVDAMLAGAYAMDQVMLKDEQFSSSPYLAGATRQFNRNSLSITNNVIVPYAWGLRKLAEYLQQLVMESNGKRVAANGESIETDPCSAFWGTVGTAAQHAYFQWLHQHPVGAAVEIIAVKPSDDVGSKALFENAVAQARALAFGFEAESNDPLASHKRTLGNRPNTFIGLPDVSPRSLGALLAHYEASVFVEAFINDINPFDQYGVEYGKLLAKQVASGSDASDFDASTKALLEWGKQVTIEDQKRNVSIPSPLRGEGAP